MATPENEQMLLDLATMLVKKEGFCADKYSTSFMDRRASFRMRSLNIATLKEYYDYVQTHPEELPLLQKELSINVTHFFRDIALWEELEKVTFPELIARKKATNDKRIFIWSAGCSSGEEAITIAIILAKLLGDDYSGFSIRILGTDISQKIVDSAKEASYHDLQFKETDPKIKEKYFIPQENDMFQAKDFLRNITEFKVGNILTDELPKGMDLLFCRNTVIYFNRDAKTNLYDQFYDLLPVKGYFIMGKTETLNGPAMHKFQTVNTRERIYQKEEVKETLVEEE